jgi:hypothetical protein
MTFVWIALSAALWIGCGVIARGLVLGEFSYRFPYMRHTAEGRLATITGPMGLAAALISGYRFKHFRLRHIPEKQRREIFMRENEILGVEYFDRNYA